MDHAPETSPEWGTDLGDAIAVIRPEPEQLATAGLQFAPGHDDLDHVRVAFMTAPSGTVYALVRHERSPSPGTEIVARSPQAPAVIAADLGSILARLGLSPDVVTWLRPDVQPILARPGRLSRLTEAVLSFLHLAR